MATFKAMSDLVADAEDLLEKLGDSAEPKVKELRGRLESSIEDMKEQLREQVRSSSESLEEITEQVVKVVRENPWIAVAAGTAMAVALMYIAFGRSPRR